jgi:hypothetical protein
MSAWIAMLELCEFGAHNEKGLPYSPREAPRSYHISQPLTCSSLLSPTWRHVVVCWTESKGRVAWR